MATEKRGCKEEVKRKKEDKEEPGERGAIVHNVIDGLDVNAHEALKQCKFKPDSPTEKEQALRAIFKQFVQLFISGTF